jgi:hypothetical protein
MTLVTEFRSGSLVYQRYSFDSYEDLENADLASTDEIDYMRLWEGPEELQYFQKCCSVDPKDPKCLLIKTTVRKFWKLKPFVEDKWGAEVIRIWRGPDSSNYEIFEDEDSQELYDRYMLWRHGPRHVPALSGYDKASLF